MSGSPSRSADATSRAGARWAYLALRNRTDAWQQELGRAIVVVATRLPQRDRVAVAQEALALHALAVDVGAIRAAEVTKQKQPLASLDDFGVLLAKNSRASPTQRHRTAWSPAESASAPPASTVIRSSTLSIRGPRPPRRRGCHGRRRAEAARPRSRSSYSSRASGRRATRRTPLLNRHARSTYPPAATRARTVAGAATALTLLRGSRSASANATSHVSSRPSYRRRAKPCKTSTDVNLTELMARVRAANASKPSARFFESDGSLHVGASCPRRSHGRADRAVDSGLPGDALVRSGRVSRGRVPNDGMTGGLHTSP